MRDQPPRRCRTCRGRSWLNVRSRPVYRSAALKITSTARPGRCAGTAAARTGGVDGESMAERADTHSCAGKSESSWICTRTYTASPDQVRIARAFLRGVLEPCPVVDEAVLLISELCTNAVQHSDSRLPGGTFTVHVEVYEGEYVRAEVRDCGGLWTGRTPRTDGGHGLEIVRKTASDWGRDGDETRGWIVWFRVDWPG